MAAVAKPGERHHRSSAWLCNTNFTAASEVASEEAVAGVRGLHLQIGRMAFKQAATIAVSSPGSSCSFEVDASHAHLQGSNRGLPSGQRSRHQACYHLGQKSDTDSSSFAAEGSSCNYFHHHTCFVKSMAIAQS